MKGIITLGVILVLIGAGTHWFIMRESFKDPGYWVAFAFGNAEESAIEMHVLVDIGMVRQEGPRLNTPPHQAWEEWITDHWDLRDASGESLAATRLGWSTLISDDKAKAVPEFYLKYMLKKGQQYTITYTPQTRSKPDLKYRYSFAAPSDTQEITRAIFDPVKK